MHILKSFCETPSVILLILFCAISLGIHAKTYKWVDEEGNVHYTQNAPPEGVESEIIRPPVKLEVDATQKKFLFSNEQSDRLRREKEAAAAKRDAEREAYQKKVICDSARVSISSFQRPRVSMQDEYGNFRRLPEEERLENLEKAKKIAEENCQ